MTAWIDQYEHRAWLSAEFVRLLDFGRDSVHPSGGASPLNADGGPDFDAPLAPYHTARVAHAYALATLAGVPGSRRIAQAVFDGLRGVQHDDRHGGWFHEVTGGKVTDDSKSAYDHAHVLMAASTALHAGLDGARDVLDEATAIVAGAYYDPKLGLLRDGYDRAFSVADDYLGANANMHGVEAMLAAFDATDDEAWLERALRISKFFISQAAAHDWRLPEHYAADATPQLDYNVDAPDDPFKPYGATIGHALEWSRLLLHLEAALAASGIEGGHSLLPAATSLFDQAIADGWAADGEPGFVYTTDFDGVPVTRDRLWWVVSEGVCAAAALGRRTGEPRFDLVYAQWWDYIDQFVLDRVRGSWHHSLTPDNKPDTGIWAGKPDLYHTVQATLIPRLPLYPGLGKAIADGFL